MANSARIDELRKKFDENPRRYFAPLANEYRKLGDVEQAIFICQEYLPQQPGHMSGHIVYGQALFEAGRTDEARSVFETALTLDPENLIALRHLGDIAHRSGDAPAARSWYQRVLEVDPRNDEIAGLIATLEAAPPAAIAADEPPPIPVAEEESPDLTIMDSTVPESSMTVERSEEPPPIPVEATSLGGSDSLLDIDDVPVTGFESSSLATEERRESPPAGVEATAPADESSDFSFDDIAPGAPASPTPTDTPVAELESIELDGLETTHAPEPGVSEHVLDSAIEGLELSTSTPTSWPTAAAETPPQSDVLDDFSIPSSVEATSETSETTEPAADHTPLETVAFDMPASEPSVEPEVQAAAPELESVSEFDIPEFETPADEPAAPLPGDVIPALGDADLAHAAEAPPVDEPVAEPAVAEQAIEESFDLPAAEISDPEFRPTPDRASAAIERERVATPSEAATPPSSSGPFVTETMAELYLQQGHLESALSIYTTLVEQRPDDSALAARRQALEEQLRSPATESAPSGPTIREFLSGLLAYRGGEPQAEDVPSAYEGAGIDTPVESAVAETGADPFADLPEPESEPESEPVAAEAPVELAEPVTPDRPSAPTPSSSRDTVSGSIDSLFGGAKAAEQDVAAASALADAFAAETPAPAAPLLTGVPAHRAANELSLDHVFRAGPPAPEADGGSNFSFDQFFAEEMTDQKPASAADQAPQNPSSADDIAQFNAWLSGLKKT